MAAKPPHMLLDCPPSRHDGGGGGRQQRQESRTKLTCGEKACAAAVLVLLVAAVITALAFLGIFLDHRFPSKDPVFTVTITGVAGLDDGGVLARDAVDPPSPPADHDNVDYSRSPPPPSPPAPAAALSPVFDFTFQIDNTRNAYKEACVPGLSRAEVSYGDAFLAGCSVPPFCAGQMSRSDNVAARAWGQNVAVPRFLRDQLAAELAAGDAAVDVKVTVSYYCRSGECGPAVLSCKAKIGGGTSQACRVDFV